MRFRILVLLAALLLVAAPGASAQTPAPEGYAWADACKECHADIYKAWRETKHSKTLNRLDRGERAKEECVGCHVTGAQAVVEVEGDVVNAGVQCEACHGPGKAHAEQAKTAPPALEGLKKPAAAVCQACHNEKSPKFKGFFYAGMVSLVHRVDK
jgi:hypothetical protein